MGSNDAPNHYQGRRTPPRFPSGRQRQRKQRTGNQIKGQQRDVRAGDDINARHAAITAALARMVILFGRELFAQGTPVGGQFGAPSQKPFFGQAVGAQPRQWQKFKKRAFAIIHRLKITPVTLQ